MASRAESGSRIERLRGVWARVRAQPWLLELLSVLGLLLFLAQASGYFFSLRSILDEGLYLVKGYLFATGEYTPYRDYGPLTNHMPLSFLVPGWVQKWFGAGLRTGRSYALVAGLVGILGLWLAARRVGGRWWAAFAVWGLALNVALVKIYSVAFSQVLVAALLAWALAFALDPRPRWWTAALAGGLGGLLLMTRINMAPVLLFLLVYLYWRHGAKVGNAGLIAAVLVVGGLHALYWPNILSMWARWLPADLFTFLEPYVAPWRDDQRFSPSPFYIWIRNFDDITWNPISAFWDGARFNYVAMVGAAANLLLWPGRGAAWTRERMRTAVFLNVSFFFLLAIHMWAALTGASCHIFCFSGYVGFFNGVGLLAIAATAPYWRKERGAWGTSVIVLIVLILGLGVGFGAADDIGRWVAEFEIPHPRGGSIPLWGLAENRFGMEYRDARQVLPALTGLGAAALLIAGLALWLWRSRDGGLRRLSHLLLVTVVGLGYVLAPTILLGGGDGTLDCGGDVVANYEAVGAQAREAIPPGSRVYYQAANSPVLLLYLDEVEIYPPQLNNVFTFSDLDDPALSDELLRFGLWHQPLAERWAAEADIILLEGRRYAEWQGRVESGELNIVLEGDVVEACRGKDSQVVVLGREGEN